MKIDSFAHPSYQEIERPSLRVRFAAQIAWSKLFFKRSCKAVAYSIGFMLLCVTIYLAVWFFMAI